MALRMYDMFHAHECEYDRSQIGKQRLCSRDRRRRGCRDQTTANNGPRKHDRSSGLFCTQFQRTIVSEFANNFCKWRWSSDYIMA
jgi:hypothetical protein